MTYKIQTILAGVLLFSGFCSAAEYQIIDLGEISLWPPLSINDNGQVVGTEPSQTTGNDMAFIWENGMKSYIPVDPDNALWATDISNLSVVTGVEFDGMLAHPFYWQNGIKTFLKKDGAFGEAKAINDSGKIVGYLASDPMAPWLSDGVLWKDANELVDLEKLTPGDTFNIAVDINNSVKIVGNSGSSGSQQAFLWEEGQDIIELDSFPEDLTTTANAINNLDQVVGYSLDPIGKYAFLWEQGVKMELVSPGDESVATAINDLSTVVGNFSTESNTLACKWENGVMVDLNTLLPEGADWILIEAHDINNNGWIVGKGTNPDGEDHHGFLLISVTEPEIISAIIDITPEVLNLKSKGRFLTCFIQLPEEYDVADIDPATIRLGENITAQWTRIYENEQILEAKFSRAEVQAIIEPGEAELTVTGELIDGSIFEGADTIRVIGVKMENNI